MSGSKSTFRRLYEILPSNTIASTTIAMVTGLFTANRMIFFMSLRNLKLYLYYRFTASRYFSTFTRLFSRKVSNPLTIR